MKEMDVRSMLLMKAGAILKLSGLLYLARRFGSCRARIASPDIRNDQPEDPAVYGEENRAGRPQSCDKS